MRSPDGSDPGLSAELAGVRERIVRSRATVADLVEGLTDEGFNQRPRPGKWSVCECIDHLVIVGEKLLPELDAGLAKAHRNGWFARRPSRYARLEAWFVRSASRTDPPSWLRFRAFSPYEPRSGQSIDIVIPSYNALQVNLVERVEAADGLDLARVKIHSPARRIFRLSLGMCLRLIAGHQERHLEQARRARAVVTDGGSGRAGAATAKGRRPERGMDSRP